MMGLSLVGWAGLFLLSCAAALVVLAVIGAWPYRRHQKTHTTTPLQSHFLFNGNMLSDHDTAERPTAPSPMDRVETWSDLRAWLAPRFDELPEDLEHLNAPLVIPASHGDGGASLHLVPAKGRTRITLAQDAPPSPAAWHDALCRIQNEDRARDILDASPYPAWQSDDTGQILWRNAACNSLFEEMGRLPEGKPNATTRFCVDSEKPAGQTWYELQSQPAGKGQIHFASDITQVIRAETVQREFIQTLTKTFANLTTGLAIFDRNRQLALFNPALFDLTGVPVTFLSARPGLIPFFDELRERQVLPEPKSYATWRSQIMDVVEQANDGFYHETWTLPTGLTYRVTGRPHPDGAIAFLFEDISAEISLTRRFRAQIDLSHSVLDRLDEAISVIGANGIVVFCNQACTDLLKIDPDTSFADMTQQDLLRTCRAFFKPDSCWKAFEQQLATCPACNAQPVRLGLIDDTVLEGRVRPLPGGARMLCFRPLADPVSSRRSQEAAL